MTQATPLFFSNTASTPPQDGFSSKCNASRYHIYTIEDAKKIFGGRKIYIWGAGQKGRGFLQALNRCGFTVESFIDSSREMQNAKFLGVGTLSPEEFFALPNIRSDAFVLTASVDSKNKQMFETLGQHGFERGLAYESIQTLSPFYPTIEVTGLCNLRCSGCVRSDKTLIETGKYMSFSDYSKVIHKLIKEIPFLYLVDLYVYDEPLLNKDLPKIIQLNNSLGIASGLSTNLNDARNLRSVLQENPALIRVSLSGASAETYEVTHTGGNWKKVEQNLAKLGALIAEQGNKTIVEIYFHAYKHNLHEAGIIKKRCEEYGFRFHPSLGIVLTSDFILSYSQGKGLPASAQPANELTLLPLDSLLEDCRREAHLNCILTRIVPVINWDLSVMPCCNYSYSKIATNFLDIPLSELIQKRTYSDVCMTCQSHALHRWNNQVRYTPYVTKTLESTTGEAQT